MMIGGILLGISLTIPFFVSSLLGLFLSQLFAGFGHTFSIVAGQSYMGHADHPLTRENNVLKFSIATSLGNFLGPLMGGYLSDTLGTPKVFLIFGLLSSCSLFLAALVSDLGKSTVSNASAWKIWQSLELLKNANFRRALMISSLILFAKDTFTAYFPLFGVEIGLTGTQIGTIISINSIAGILVRLFTPKLLALFGRTRVTMGTIFITGLFLILVPLSKEFVVSCFFSFALGIGIGMGFPLSMTASLVSLPKERMAEGLGLRLTANRLTQTVTPFAIGVLANYFTLSSVFIVAGGVILLGLMKTKMKFEDEAYQKSGHEQEKFERKQ